MFYWATQSMSTADLVATIAAAIAFGSAVISVLAIYFPWRNVHDSEVFKEAVMALERAYATLTNRGESTSPPVADRLNWLTTARHIEAYKSLKSRLKTDLFKSLCKENEEYWRHQFYLSLLRNPIHLTSYFENGRIEPRSAIVIFCFSAWPKDKQDSIDILDIEALFEEYDLLKGNVGLKEYLGQFPEYGGKTELPNQPGPE